MRRLITLTFVVIWLTLSALPASAHPLGNYTTNVHLGIHVDADVAAVRLVVDMAEIPTFREPLDRDGDDEISRSELTEYADGSCEALRADVTLVGDSGARIELFGTTRSAQLNPGQSDLDTLRIDCGYIATLDTTSERLEVSNRAYEDRIGWAEIVVTGAAAPGIPSTSPSDVLTAYPEGAPSDVRTATVGFTEVAPPTGDVDTLPAESGGFLVDRLGSMLEDAGSTGGLIAVAAALALGAVHALAPGHGKTLMAAYLVGRDGTSGQAAGLGLAVAVSHTVGVAVLGLITATASTQFRPEAVYPWLTTGSAIIVTGLGVVMLVRAARGRTHSHDHGHSHGEDADHHHEPPADLGWRSLAALGLAGGLVPSASAVVLLLGAIAIGRPWFGVGLVFAFGVGMSLALVAAGLIALKLTSTGLDRLGRSWKVPERLVPGLAGIAVTAVGSVLLWDALRTLA